MVDDTKWPPALDLAALREKALDSELLAQNLTPPTVVLSLLDRIEELERRWHVEKHGCSWVDCPENPPYHSVPHNHCPDDCRFKGVSAK